MKKSAPSRPRRSSSSPAWPTSSRPSAPKAERSNPVAERRKADRLERRAKEREATAEKEGRSGDLFLVESVAFGGSGIVRREGKTGFVPMTIDGETALLRVTREKRQFFEAEVLSLVQASPHRVKPPCPYYGVCGGCSYQHISYEHQLEIKHRQVEETLRRLAGVETPPMRAIIPSPEPLGYRNRITVHIAGEGGRIGFYARKGASSRPSRPGHEGERELLDIGECLLAAPEVNRSLLRLRANPPKEGSYTLRLDKRHKGIFQQVNDAAALLLRAELGRALSTETTVLVDAYCGSGFYSQEFLPRFRQVIGLEWDEDAVKMAREATAEGAPHADYTAGDVAETLPPVLQALASEGVRASLILNPPSEGVADAVRRAVSAHPPEEIIYVSCDASTLARDLRAWSALYELVSVTPVDLFPQTAEIEVIAHLRRKNATQS